jgi:hypothetical protein
MTIGKLVHIPKLIRPRNSENQKATWYMRVMFIATGSQLEFRLLSGKESFEEVVRAIAGITGKPSELSDEDLRTSADAIKLFTRAFQSHRAVQLNDGSVVWTEVATVR